MAPHEAEGRNAGRVRVCAVPVVRGEYGGRKEGNGLIHLTIALLAMGIINLHWAELEKSIVLETVGALCIAVSIILNIVEAWKVVD